MDRDVEEASVSKVGGAAPAEVEEGYRPIYRRG